MEELIEDFLEISHIALFGVTDQKTHAGYKIFKALQKKNYKVFPVNPRFARIDKAHCYGNLDELPGVPQAIVITMSPEATLEVVKAASAQGIRRFWIEPDSVSDEVLGYLGEHSLQAIHETSILDHLGGNRSRSK